MEAVKTIKRFPMRFINVQKPVKVSIFTLAGFFLRDKQRSEAFHVCCKIFKVSATLEKKAKSNTF